VGSRVWDLKLRLHDPSTILDCRGWDLPPLIIKWNSIVWRRIKRWTTRIHRNLSRHLSCRRQSLKSTLPLKVWRHLEHHHPEVRNEEICQPRLNTLNPRPLPPGRIPIFQNPRNFISRRPNLPEKHIYSSTPKNGSREGGYAGRRGAN
jgi:hypothetical protein